MYEYENGDQVGEIRCVVVSNKVLFVACRGELWKRTQYAEDVHVWSGRRLVARLRSIDIVLSTVRRQSARRASSGHQLAVSLIQFHFEYGGQCQNFADTKRDFAPTAIPRPTTSKNIPINVSGKVVKYLRSLRVRQRRDALFERRQDPYRCHLKTSLILGRLESD